MNKHHTWTDISDHFDFVELDKLVYIDFPLEGFLRDKSGDLFAFQCTAIIPHRLWHWTLVPTSSTEQSVDHIFQTAKAVCPVRWISIVEDRRDDPPRLDARWITDAAFPLHALHLGGFK